MSKWYEIKKRDEPCDLPYYKRDKNIDYVYAKFLFVSEDGTLCLTGDTGVKIYADGDWYQVIICRNEKRVKFRLDMILGDDKEEGVYRV